MFALCPQEKQFHQSLFPFQAHPDEWLKRASLFGADLGILEKAAPNMELAWKAEPRRTWTFLTPNPASGRPWLKEPFRAETIPVHVILNPKAALPGAACHGMGPLEKGFENSIWN